MEVLVDCTPELIARMNDLSSHYEDVGDRYRAATFSKASKIFTAMTKVGWLFAEPSDIEGIDGIGASTREEALLVMEEKPSPRLPAPTPVITPVTTKQVSSMVKALLRLPTFTEERAKEMAQLYPSMNAFAQSMDAKPLDREFLEHMDRVPKKLKVEVAKPVINRFRDLLRGHVNCIVRGHYMDVLVFSDNTRTYGMLEISNVVADGVTTHLLHRGASESWLVNCQPELTVLIKIGVAPSRDRSARELARRLKPDQWLAAQAEATKLGVSLLPGSIRRAGRSLPVEEADEICTKIKGLVI